MCEAAWIGPMSQVKPYIHPITTKYHNHNYILFPVNFLPWCCAWYAFLWLVLVGIKYKYQYSSIFCFSDHYGRLPTIIIANMVALVTGVATPFVTGHISFFILRWKMSSYQGFSYYCAGFWWVFLSTHSSQSPTHLVKHVKVSFKETIKVLSQSLFECVIVIAPALRLFQSIGYNDFCIPEIAKLWKRRKKCNFLCYWKINKF